jgi:hypothetical protein
LHPESFTGSTNFIILSIVFTLDAMRIEQMMKPLNHWVLQITIALADGQRINGAATSTAEDTAETSIAVKVVPSIEISNTTDDETIHAIAGVAYTTFCAMFVTTPI